MITFKNKKELDQFINNIDGHIGYLINKLNEYYEREDISEYYQKNIDCVQKYYENEFLKQTPDIQDKLRMSFWAFFSKLLMENLGGEIVIASKTDYSAGTPLLINYGNRLDNRGKKKWIGIGFNSWLESHISNKALISLKGKIEKLIKDYS